MLPKRCIEITSHAHHRAVSRFGLTRDEATHQIRTGLREGTWYASPEAADEYLVVHRVAGDNACIVGAVEDGAVHVRTVYPLRNLGQLRPYKQAGGPYSARDIVDAYRRLD